MQTSRTFRIFVSSTFSDLIAERNALQERVFPKLRQLCEAHGCRFQAIDLRWGVSDEAALDQQTMRICLGEIERCQRVSPRPNFIVLLGNRYGWRPLPYEIPADEFEQILSVIQETEKSFLDQWYSRDENALPAVYHLQPRQGGYTAYEAWETVELRLREIVLSAVKHLSFSPDNLLKYDASATEQEIVSGALNAKDARQHVFCFFREIEGLPQAYSQGFGNKDAEEYQKQEALKGRLRQHLGNNVHEYTASWQGEGPTTDHLDALCDDVYKTLSGVILDEIQRIESIDPLESEIYAHEDFRRERSKVFIGRDEMLTIIADYLSADAQQALLLWGESGSGKSALLAKAVQQAQESGREVIYRFIGATPDSSSGRSLLESLCAQIARRYLVRRPATASGYKELVEEFPKRLAQATAQKPLIIFLDALDQLSDADHARDLTWLPAALPPNVWIVLSTIPDECYQHLEGKLEKKRIVKIPSMTPQDGESILSSWLAQEGRVLQPVQNQYVLDRFVKCPLPLYLKLAFEEARLWKSYDQPQEFGEDIHALLSRLFERLSLEANHGRTLVMHSLGYLGAARHGLSEDELIDVLSRDEAVLRDFQRRSPKSPKVDRLPAILWSRLFFDLEPYLSERNYFGTSLLAFYHRQLSEAVHSRFLSPDIKSVRHQALAAYFSDQQLELESDHEKKVNLRKISEQPFQLAMAGLNDGLADTLSSFDFMQASITAFDPYEFIDQFRLMDSSPVAIDTSTKDALNLIRDALILSSHVLQEDPHQLAGQLIGRLQQENGERINKTLTEASKWWAGSTWLCPLQVKLAAPGGNLQATINGVKGGPFLTVSPDSSQAAVLSNINNSTRSLQLWNLPQARLVKSFERISEGAMTPDGKRAVLFSTGKVLNDNEIYVDVVDLQSGNVTKNISGQGGKVIAAAIAPDGRMAASLSYGGNAVKVWDARDGQEVFEWDTSNVDQLYPLRGGLFVVLKHNGLTPRLSQYTPTEYPVSLRLWDARQGKCLLEIDQEQRKTIRVFTTARNDSYLIWASFKDVTIYDTDTRQSIAQLECPVIINDLKATTDGKKLIAACQNGYFHVWDLESMTDLRTFNCQGTLNWNFEITPDGRTLFAYQSKTVEVWDIDHGQLLRQITVEEGQIKKIEVFPDNQRIFIHTVIGKQSVIGPSQTAQLRIIDIKSGETLHLLEGGDLFATSRNGKFVVFLYKVDQQGKRISKGTFEFSEFVVWDVEKWVEVPGLSGKRTEKITMLAITSDGKKVFSASTPERQLQVWDTVSGETSAQLELAFNTDIHDLLLSPDEDYILTLSSNYRVHFWDLENGMETHSSKGPVPLDVIISADDIAVIESKYGSVYVWDMRQDAPLFRLHDLGLGSLFTLSGNGKYLVMFGNMGGTVTGWDIKTGQEVFSHSQVRWINNAFAISEEGNRFLTIRWPATQKPGDVPKLGVIDLQQEHSENQDLLDLRSDDSGWNLIAPHRKKATAISLDGKLAATSTQWNQLDVWDMTTGERVQNFIIDSGNGITTAAVAPNNRQIVTSTNSTLQTWALARSKEVPDTALQQLAVVQNVVVTADEQRALLGTDKHTIKVIDLNDLQEVYTLDQWSGNLLTMVGNEKFAFNFYRCLSLRSLEDGKELHRIEKSGAAVLTPDGLYGIVDHGECIEKWDILQKSLRFKIDKRVPEEIRDIKINPEGTRAIAYFTNHNKKGYGVWIFDLEEGRELSYFESPYIRSFELSPNGKYALLVTYEIIKIWEIETGKAIFSINQANNGVWITPDEARLVIHPAVGGGPIGPTRIWNILTGKEIGDFPISGGLISFLPDGERGLFSVYDIEKRYTVVKVLRLDDFSQLTVLEGRYDSHQKNEFSRNAQYMYTAVAPDEIKVVTDTVARIIRAWDLASGKCLGSFHMDHGISSLNVLSDEKTIIAGDVLGQVHVLKLEGQC